MPKVTSKEERATKILVKFISSQADLYDDLGNWSFKVEEDHIYMINERKNKKYQINLTEV
tara:strand:+ start:1670 stop:1849 length:180 start_codon:yes stop_codon:yes gene_type:complete